MKQLNQLEQDVLDKCLAGDGDCLNYLRLQSKALLVKNRVPTVVGFYTTFDLPNWNAACLDLPKTFRIGDVILDSKQLMHGAGFLLYVENGYITMLEGFTYDEAWPEKLEQYSLSYVNVPRIY